MKPYRYIVTLKAYNNETFIKYCDIPLFKFVRITSILIILLLLIIVTFINLTILYISDTKPDAIF